MYRGNPVLTFRLEAEKIQKLQAIAKVYGAENTSTFLREMVGAIISGDAFELQSFLHRYMAKAAEQQALDILGAVGPQKRPRKATNTRRPAKRRKRHERHT